MMIKKYLEVKINFLIKIGRFYVLHMIQNNFFIIITQAVIFIKALLLQDNLLLKF